MDAQRTQLQQDIVLDACKDTIARTRRVLFVVSVLIGLGLFHLFDWYLSWDLAGC